MAIQKDNRHPSGVVTLLILLSILVNINVQAEVWYASPNASITGTGSLDEPWPLHVALSNPSSVIQPGDTLYLRGGDYVGPGFISTISGTSSNYVTVRSYPNEWAVITDGQQPRLLTDLSVADPYSIATNVTITGTHTATPGNVIVIGLERVRLHGRMGNSTNWAIVRGWDGTSPTVHTPGTVATFDSDFITQNGSYTLFRDFEITSVLSTNRTVGTTNALGSGLNLTKAGHGNKAVNLIIHNVGHPAIGFWEQGEGGEINGCVLWGNGEYDNDGAWTRGNGIYAQNIGGTAVVKNVITFRNFTFGAKVFGETGPVRDFQFIENIAFGNPGVGQLASISGSTATSNILFAGNSVLGILDLAYVSTGNSHQYVVGNTIVNGGLKTQENSNSVYTNNTIFNFKDTIVSEFTPAENGYRSSLLAKNQLNITWDHNTWYIGNNSSMNAWNFITSDTPAQWRTFDLWKAVSGFDTHSTVSTNWPTDYLKIAVQVSDYDEDRWHICVINSSPATLATLDLSSIGFRSGESYKLRDAQNYFTVLDSGVYTQGTINLPLTLNSTSEILGLEHFVNKHTNVDHPGLFNTFVLHRSQNKTRPSPPLSLRVVND